MFTGIVAGMFPVVWLKKSKGLLQYAIELPNKLLKDLAIGASVAVAGVCQTVVKIEGQHVYFDAMEETLNKTNLDSLVLNQMVNIERALKIGDEIGGHQLSGHVFGTVTIKSIDKSDNNFVVWIDCPKQWMKYMMPKGFVALNGASLTIVDVKDEGEFSVHLIPETLRATTFGHCQVGDGINLELDSMTQATVDTIERMLVNKFI